MTNQKLIIKKLILKKECASVVEDFYNPFASFYVLPVLHTVTDRPLLLVEGTMRWANHLVHVSYNNTRQLKEKEYSLGEVEHFKLHVHLIQQEVNLPKIWKQVQQAFEQPVSHGLSRADFKSYVLAMIPIDWQLLEHRKYENDLIELELLKNK